jgi:hypothetical protein
VQVVAPSEVSLTSPVQQMSQLQISRAMDLALGWSGGGAGELVFSITPPQTGLPTDPVALTCRFPASDGQGTIPRTALGALPQGGGTVDVFVVASAEVETAGYSIRLDASTAAFAADGSQLSYLYIQ